MRFLFISLLALGSTLPVSARSAGRESAAFLEIPVGAGPAALGAAYTAKASDAYAPTWNPAGLGFLQTTDIAAQHLAYLEDHHYEHASLAYRLSKNQGLGVSFQYLGSRAIEGVDETGASIGDFSTMYSAASLAYGHRIGSSFSLGITGKWIHARLADVTASAYAADIGIMHQTTSNLRLAVTVQNLGTDMKFIEQADPLPRAVHVAALYHAPAHIDLLGEGVFAFLQNPQARAGLQWSPIPALALRVGYRTDTVKGLSPLAGLTTGIGLILGGHELGYAWLPMGDLGTTHYISAVLRFGALAHRHQFIHYHPRNALKIATTMDEEDDPEQILLLETLSDRTIAQTTPSKP